MPNKLSLITVKKTGSNSNNNIIITAWQHSKFKCNLNYEYIT